MAENKETLVDWLRDAYAMEKAAIDMLENQQDRLEHYPEMKNKVTEHLEMTRRQAERVEQCLQRYGEEPSALKDLVSRFMGNTGAFFNAAAGDEVVKNALGNYAFENFEIASYRSLVAAAEALGETETKNTCQEILQEEQEMAKWLDQHLDGVTNEFLTREVSPGSAKR